MSSTSPPPTCATCPEPGTLKCAGCQDIWFCSVECQQTDWREHSKLCKHFKDFQARPEKNMRRVFYMPKGSHWPEFRWLPVKKTADNYESVDTMGLMGDAEVWSRPITSNETTQVPYDGMIQLMYDRSVVCAYQRDPDVTATVLHGPQIAICGQPMSQDQTEKPGEGQLASIRDFDMTAYSVLTGHAFGPKNLRWGSNNYRAEPYLPQNLPKIEAVRFNCVGEMRINHGPDTQCVLVPRDHPVFLEAGITSEISVAVGLPLLVYRYPATKKQSRGFQDGDDGNPAIWHMQTCCSPSKPYFGYLPPPPKSGKANNAFVVRKDRLPLDKEIAEVFGFFCRSLTVHFNWAREAQAEYPGTEEACKKVVLAQITPSTWQKFLSDWHRDTQAAKHIDSLTHGLAELCLGSIAGAERELWDENKRPRHPKQLQ